MRAIVTKFVPASDRRGSRISVTCGAKRRFLSYDHAAGHPHRQAVLEFCEEQDWTGTLAEAEFDRGYVYVWVDANADDSQFEVGNAELR